MKEPSAERNMIRKMIAAAVLGLLLAASRVMAQEGHWQEISV